jgi:Arc/MetJ-type ribon-helix-helix transcriptional regulator
MQFNVPADIEALVQKRLATGAFTDVEDVIRRALESLEAEEDWSLEDKAGLRAKIDRAMDQVAAGRVYSPDEARWKLSALREAHLANRSR